MALYKQLDYTVLLSCLTTKNISDSTVLYPYDTNRCIAYVPRYMSLCFNVYSSYIYLSFAFQKSFDSRILFHHCLFFRRNDLHLISIYIDQAQKS